MPTAHSIPTGLVVYFVQAGDAGPIKIGQTTGLAKRLDSLKTGSSIPLRFLGAVAVHNRHKFSERGLHARFRRFRLHGEWFSPAPEILDFVAMHGSIDMTLFEVREGRRTRPSVALDQIEAAEVAVIKILDEAGVDRRVTCRALKISPRTYYRRRNLPAEVRAAWESSEAVYSRTEGGCV